MIYADTSALVKLAVTEPESAALRAWFTAHAGEPVATSVLTEVELSLALARRGLPPSATAAVISGLYLVELGAPVRSRAAGYGHLGLRSLDAIHAASASELALRTGQEVVVVGYDAGLLEACRTLGLTGVSPPSRPVAPSS